MTAVEFSSPLRGLGPQTSYALDPVDGAEGLFTLRSVDGDVRLFLLDPATVDDGYRPAVPAGIRSEVGAVDGSDLRILVVANPAGGGISLNLRAPIVMHPDSGRAAQIILEDQRYPIRSLLKG